MLEKVIINVKEKRLEYTTDNIKSICTPSGDCFIDKTETRELLLGVIKNFNEANPKFKIEIKE